MSSPNPPRALAGFGDRFALTLLTDAPRVAEAGVAAGIDRIGIDLETLGKEKRQDGLGARISAHSIDRLPEISEAIGAHPLFVRINPLNDGSRDEIDRVIAEGATHLMLPYFHTIEEAATFARLVNGRSQAILLVETAAAAYFVEELVRIPGITGIHVGLTDLKISLGIPVRFETLASWMIDGIAEQVHGAGLELHAGGITRVNTPELPIPSDLINAQFPRFNGTGALVSRTFHAETMPAARLAEEVRAFRDDMNRWGDASRDELESQRRRLKAYVHQALSQNRAMP